MKNNFLFIASSFFKEFLDLLPIHSPYMLFRILPTNSISSSVKSKSILSLLKRFIRMKNTKIKVNKKDNTLANGDMKAKTIDINEVVTGANNM
jgi:hypothetical protein